MPIDPTDANNLNLKRLVEEFTHESLTDIRSSRSLRERTLQNAETLSLQILQNAIETANMLSKQAVNHIGIQFDRTVNVDEVANLTAKSGAQADALMTLLTQVVAEVVKKGTATP